ncbi:MAG: hypothetical protein O2960_24120 [Verrucomicrobia bacterium]|nr:hypothetical protein [Verrucomicrobiota bacterium]
MTHSHLKALLEPITKSYRAFHLVRGLAICWAWSCAVVVILLTVYELSGWWMPAAIPLLLSGIVAGAAVVWTRVGRFGAAYKGIAQQIERENPRLNSLLLAAVAQKPDETTGGLNYLQVRVINDALSENQRQPWAQRYVERLFFAQCLQWFGLALLTGLVIAAVRIAPSAPARLAAAGSITISPGDTNVVRGSGLVVLARFGSSLPKDAVLIVNSANDNNRRIPLVKNLDDPVFGGMIPEVKSDLVYEIEFGNTRTKCFKVTVFDFPEVVQADATLTYPDYTGLPKKTIEDTRHISAVEGTVLDYSFRLNKPVASATLLSRDNAPILLTPEDSNSNLLSLKLPLIESTTYTLELVDSAGRANKMPTEIVIDVLENRPPELKLTFPRRDLRVSPIEEVSLVAEASDDFGMKGYGVAYALGGTEPTYVELGQTAGALEKQALNDVVKLEDLSAQPDNLLSYFLWADDLGPDGEIRRTSGDLYFAEVKHFEEIFREGQGGEQQQQQQQSGQQGGQQSPSQKLAELQKEILNATWNIRRRENRTKPSSKYKEDAEVVRDSQEEALEQATELQTQNERPDFKPLIDSVIKEMEKALEQLTDATEENSTKPLPSAIAAEQASYQALLKLQAREFQVSRSQSGGGGGGGGGGRSQQQLNQLELSQTENRYETERQATQQQQNPQQREQLQVLNRLRELARRQADLNQRLQELQTALQEAKSEDEQEAVRRQLKRLKDEERELLSDVDSLQQRMNRPENQSQMSEAKQQLEQTRSDVRRAAEALENEAVSQALAAGTRAERSLQELREDFRKQTSSQFSDEVKQLRSQARELAEKQETIAQEIEKLAQPERKVLSDSDQRNALADQLAEQKGGLTNILTNMRRITESAEHAEPLLSKQLYDTIRKTDQTKANNSVEMSSELLRRGFVTQAAEPERQARQIIDNLRKGVETAAESVLGDELESLRLARSELDDLTRQLNQEIEEAMRGQPGNPSAGTSTNRSRAAQSAQASQNGEPGQQTAQNGQQGSDSSQSSNESQSPNSQGQSQTAANSQQQGNQPGQRGQGEQPGQQGQGQRGQGQGQGQQGGQQASSEQGQQGSQSGQAGGRGGNRSGGDQQGPGGARTGGGGGGWNDVVDRFSFNGGPLTGRNFTEWSDRMRDVEEMVSVPELRTRIAEIRERAQNVRVDLKRHSKDPQWDLVQADIAAPLVEVRQRVSEELARRESNDSLVPIDRDPVPVQYSELVRRYYEELGSSSPR